VRVNCRRYLKVVAAECNDWLLSPSLGIKLYKSTILMAEFFDPTRFFTAYGLKSCAD
jgi:hypothetical protein